MSSVVDNHVKNKQRTRLTVVLYIKQNVETEKVKDLDSTVVQIFNK